MESLLPTCQDGMSFVIGSIATQTHTSPMPLPLNSSGMFFALAQKKLQISSHSSRLQFRLRIVLSQYVLHASPTSTSNRITVFLAIPVILTVDRMLQPSTRHDITRVLSSVLSLFI